MMNCAHVYMHAPKQARVFPYELRPSIYNIIMSFIKFILNLYYQKYLLKKLIFPMQMKLLAIKKIDKIWFIINWQFSNENREE